MPTYTCTAPTGCLSPERKAALAALITATHSAVTGAQKGFAQVVFHDLPPENLFVGGEPAREPQLFVNGQIRAGRSALDRQRLITELVEGCAKESGLPLDAIWVYVTELPPRAMAEFGQILPEPGDEAAWIAALPEAARSRMMGSKS